MGMGWNLGSLGDFKPGIAAIDEARTTMEQLRGKIQRTVLIPWHGQQSIATLASFRGMRTTTLRPWLRIKQRLLSIPKCSRQARIPPTIAPLSPTCRPTRVAQRKAGTKRRSRPTRPCQRAGPQANRTPERRFRCRVESCRPIPHRERIPEFCDAAWDWNSLSGETERQPARTMSSSKHLPRLTGSIETVPLQSDPFRKLSR